MIVCLADAVDVLTADAAFHCLTQHSLECMICSNIKTIMCSVPGGFLTRFSLSHRVAIAASVTAFVDLARALGTSDVEVGNELPGVAIADGTPPETVHQVLADANDRLDNLGQIQALGADGYAGPLSFGPFADSASKAFGLRQPLKDSITRVQQA